MSKTGDLFVRFCTGMRSIPAALLCVILFITQCSVMDFYLIEHLGSIHYAWVVGDVINVTIFVSCIYMSNRSLAKQREHENPEVSSVAWLVWILSGGVLSAKVIIIFFEVSHKIEEEQASFFGPNTLKTTIALGSVIFLLLLTTQHDAPLGSDRRRYIDELTGTVVFDILDTVDILEILFEEDSREMMWPALEECILAVAAFNLTIPAMPLFTLSRTKFGHSKLRKKMIYLHRVLMVLLVNVPNLLVRMILWHGFSFGVTPFTLKNIILIGMVCYEFYEHKVEKYNFHRREEQNGDGGGDSSDGVNNKHHDNEKKNDSFTNDGYNGEHQLETLRIPPEVEFSLSQRVITPL